MGLNRILNNKIHDIFEEPETKVRLLEQPRLIEGEDSQSFIFIAQSLIEYFLGYPRGTIGLTTIYDCYNII